MRYALLAVQRARTPLALNVVPEDGTFEVVPGENPAYVALLGTYRTQVLAEHARRNVEGLRTVAEAGAHFRGEGLVVVAAENGDGQFRTTVLRACGSVLAVTSILVRPATVGIFGIFTTQPHAAMVLNRVRDADVRTIAHARAALAGERVAA